jgi:hypothetical protein
VGKAEGSGKQSELNRGTFTEPSFCNENSKMLNCKLNRIQVVIMTLNWHSSSSAYLTARVSVVENVIWRQDEQNRIANARERMKNVSTL